MISALTPWILAAWPAITTLAADGDGALNGAIRGGIIGGAIGAVAGAGMYLFKRKTPPKQ